MPCYSSDQFFQDWRYAVGKEFTRPDGSEFIFANHGKLEWGDEIRKLTFSEAPHNSTVSDDGSRLAVAVGEDIHIIDTNTWETLTVLRGHTSDVDGMGFKPGDSKILVTCAQNNYGLRDPNMEPVIIVWDIGQNKQPSALDDEFLNEVSKVAAKEASSNLAGREVHLTDAEVDELKDALAPTVRHIVAKRAVKDHVRIHGRLQSSRSQLFSPSGKWMAYLPGDSPRSNGKDVWDIKICETDSFKDHVTLKGHFDAIMWIGWNQDETLIGTVAWDNTVRIWNAATGDQIYQFKTENQNWVGGFSPDSKFFAAACGDGSLHIYALSDGTTHWAQQDEEKGRTWRRSLDWHPNSKWLAIGGRHLGRISILDVEKKEVMQQRTLSTSACQPDDEEVRRMMGSWTEISQVEFVDQGNKLAAWIGGDGSAEVFDLVRGVKWRFARGGTDDGPKSQEWRDEKGKVKSQRGGSGMSLWEDESAKQLKVASVDYDGIRIWSVDLAKAEQ